MSENILDRIIAVKHEEMKLLRPQAARIREQLSQATAPLDFAAALRPPTGELSIISEVKKASPSAGIIAADFDPVARAKAYAEAGTNAISVLTDEQFFKGHLDFLRDIRAELPNTPLLRKDFIIDELQIEEARATGADTFLLIVAALEKSRLQKMLEFGRSLGMEALVEIHDEEERDIALDCGVKILGVNNRNLKTFTTDLATTERLVKGLSKDLILVGESGIKTQTDSQRMQACGCSAILVGESLMRKGELGCPELLQQLTLR